MEVKRQFEKQYYYEKQYYEENTTDEVWMLVDGELKQITGEGDEDDDSEEGQ